MAKEMLKFGDFEGENVILRDMDGMVESPY